MKHEASRKFITHQASPSVSITPKSMIYRDTGYLKMCFKKFEPLISLIEFIMPNMSLEL